MLRALVARPRVSLDLLIGVVGLRGWYTRPCPARAADPQASVEVPLLRRLARMVKTVGFGAVPTSLHTVALMHPTLVAKPFHRAGWIYEGEGGRLAHAGLEGSPCQVRLIRRQGKDHTTRFPEIAAAVRRLETPSGILDGEVAIYDRRLISRFEWLRHASPPDLATPALFMVFDCPYARGKDLRRQPLYMRRNVIEDLLDGQDLVLPVRRLSDG